MEKMYQEYKDIAEFRIVYIHEAHAADSDWAVKYAKEKGINNATNYGERCSTAKKLVEDKSLTIPFIVDDMDNKVNEAYRAWPDRIFLIRKDGRLAVAGKRGPWGYKPALDEAGKWLAAYRKTGDEPVLSEEDLQAGMKADEARAASQKNDEKIGAIEKKDDRPLAHYTSEYPMGRQHNRPIVEKDGKTLLWAKGNPDGDDAEWFDMTDSLIDPVKLQFGIGKDRIPSIDEPEFAKPGDPKLAEAGINDSTIVVGFEHDGVAKAYPIAILNGHEVVNDTFKGQPFAVCW